MDIIRKCPKCQKEFNVDEKFCSSCGCNLEEYFIENPICPRCHTTYQAGTIFCAKDGEKLTSPEKLIPRCIKCGTQYPDGVRFCPKDGGTVISEAYLGKRYSIENNIKVLNKANLMDRFLAYLLDGLITLGLSLPSIFFLTIGTTLSDDYDTKSESAILILLAILLYIIPIVYAFIKDGIGDGQSYGKKALGLKVVNVVDLSPCTKGRSCLRNLVSGLISCIPLIGCLIEPIMVIATTDGRKIGDKAAETQVINK